MDSACCEFILVWSSNLKNELKKKLHILHFLFYFCHAVSSIKTRTVSNASFGEPNRNSGKDLCVSVHVCVR